jgi:hypothetical protein
MEHIQIRKVEHGIMGISLVQNYRMEQVKLRVKAFCQKQGVFQRLRCTIGKVCREENIFYAEQVRDPVKFEGIFDGSLSPLKLRTDKGQWMLIFIRYA